MSNLIGKWDNDLSIENVKSLRRKGYNALFLHIDFFYKKIKKLYPSETEENCQVYTANLMFNYYKKFVDFGFKFFLIDIGWGLDDIDKNYFYKRIVDRFVSPEITNIEFYFGEMYENMVEKGILQNDGIYKKYTYADWDFVMNKKWNYVMMKSLEKKTKNFILTDTTKRNFLNLWRNFGSKYKLAVSSYYNVYSFLNLVQSVWIMGQPSILASYRYKKIKREMQMRNVNRVFLYQGNIARWDADGWLLKLLNCFFGLGNWISKKLENYFLKVFAEQK